MKNKQQENLEQEIARNIADKQKIAALRGLSEKRDGVRRSNGTRENKLADFKTKMKGYDFSLLWRIRQMDKVHTI
jgi:hypothetical protein